MATTINSDQNAAAEALRLLMLSERNRRHLHELLDLEVDEELPPIVASLLEALRRIEQVPTSRLNGSGNPQYAPHRGTYGAAL